MYRSRDPRLTLGGNKAQITYHHSQLFGPHSPRTCGHEMTLPSLTRAHCETISPGHIHTSACVHPNGETHFRNRKRRQSPLFGFSQTPTQNGQDRATHPRALEARTHHHRWCLVLHAGWSALIVADVIFERNTTESAIRADAPGSPTLAQDQHTSIWQHWSP